MLHTASLVIFCGFVGFIILWDMFIVLFSGCPGATISYVVYSSARKSPSVALFIGIVVGHLLWPTLDLNKYNDNSNNCVCKHCSSLSKESNNYDLKSTQE